MSYSDPIYGSLVLNMAGDTNYVSIGGESPVAYGGTPVKIAPSAGVLGQMARPRKQLGAQHFNWIMNQTGLMLAALKTDGVRVENDLLAFITTVNNTLATREAKWKDTWLRIPVLSWREVWGLWNGAGYPQTDLTGSTGTSAAAYAAATGTKNIFFGRAHNQIFMVGFTGTLAGGQMFASHMHIGEHRMSNNIIVGTVAGSAAIEQGDTDDYGNALLAETRSSKYVWFWHARLGTSSRLDTGGTAPSGGGSNAGEHSTARVVFDPIRLRWVWVAVAGGLQVRYSAVSNDVAPATPFNVATTAPTLTGLSGIAYQWDLGVDKTSGRIVLATAHGALKSAYSDDGGINWNTNTDFATGVGTTNSDSYSLVVVDANTWFMVAGQRIWKTTNAGSSWTLVRWFNSGGTIANVRSLAFINTAMGRIWGAVIGTNQGPGSGTAQATTDGVNTSRNGEFVYSLDECVTWYRTGLRLQGGKVIGCQHCFAIFDGNRMLISTAIGTHDPALISGVGVLGHVQKLV